MNSFYEGNGKGCTERVGGGEWVQRREDGGGGEVRGRETENGNVREKR